MILFRLSGERLKFHIPLFQAHLPSFNIPPPHPQKRKLNFNRGKVMFSSACHRFPAVYSNHTLHFSRVNRCVLIGLLVASTVRVNGHM